MPHTLQELQANAQSRYKASNPGSTSEAIYSFLSDLLETLIVSPSSADIDSLKAQITRLNETINWQNGILQAVKTALETPDDVTMTQLPVHAKAIMAWAKTGTPPPPQ